jgi:signal transduction histidine kinase
MRQTLHNLLENALRFTPEGGSVTVKAAEIPAGRLLVTVADTGSGINAADLSHVFDHFYKADRSRQRLHGGAGIGLALVKKYVELHGGAVMVESLPGQGSTFSFNIPTPA